jgi:hypothetical protein
MSVTQFLKHINTHKLVTADSIAARTAREHSMRSKKDGTTWGPSGESIYVVREQLSPRTLINVSTLILLNHADHRSQTYWHIMCYP